MDFLGLMENIGKGVDAAGVAIIVVGVAIASVLALTRLTRREAGIYEAYRRRLGRSILLGLEFLVAGDIIRTVAVTARTFVAATSSLLRQASRDHQPPATAPCST